MPLELNGMAGREWQGMWGGARGRREWRAWGHANENCEFGMRNRIELQRKVSKGGREKGSTDLFGQAMLVGETSPSLN